MPRKTRLFLTEIKSVGLVEAGACTKADVLFYKSAGERGVTKEDGDAATFNEINAAREVYRMMDELSGMYSTLCDSLYRIASDGEVADKLALIRTSIDEFSAAARDLFDSTGVEKVGAKVSAARMQRIKSAYEALKAVMEEVMSKPTEKQADKAPAIDREKLDPAVKAVLEAAEKTATDATAENATLKARNAELEKAAKPEPTEADVLKNADPAVKALIEKQATELAAVKARQEESDKRANEEIEKREVSEAIAKAEKEYPLIGKAETVGKIIQKIRAGVKLEKADADELERMLTAASAQLKASGLLKEIGVSGDGDGKTAAAEVLAKAEEIRKAKPSLSLVQAKVEARRQYPDLAKAEKAEQDATRH